MIPLRHLLTAALLAALTGAQAAQPTYRIVGPDGKVTYSDRKPTDPAARTRELGQIVSAPLLTPGSQPFDLRPATALPSGARPALGEGLTPAVDISGLPFPPGLPDAILDVVIHQFWVQTLVETCSRVRPENIARYQGGVRNWRDRNAEILARSNHITFTRFTGEQRDMLRATARARLTQLVPAAGSADADREAWCDRMSTDLARHHFELVGDLRVAPILAFAQP
jgi:hypothetical protein